MSGYPLPIAGTSEIRGLGGATATANPWRP